MSNWLKENSLSIGLALITLVSTYAVYGYRIGAIEARQDRQGDAIQTLQQGNVDTKVALAKISTDIDYIKTALAQLVANQNK